ncbi:MAG: phosphoribosylpyrophosphate synthetase [Acidobacteria bacterium]|nr:MAG: phosphoribosylpyrophosphate synthetase [Acidobacteriota bacterium]PYV00321.1 MAG: phosphoribosylpyrophosphate synthetase [Acidobacteriota bacterium]PYV39090.1 MAG: phosphoribosylpyrophosphate synthetase [Acidobacteriota bacterium]
MRRGYGALSSELKVFSGHANRPLAEEICQRLEIPLGNAVTTTFSDGELYFQILENVRGTDVFVIQPTCPPVNNNLMELLIMIDAFKRASAARITAVIPYYGYARQDRKDKPRVPISSKLVADILTAAGTSRILTMDLHATQIQGFFNIPVDHLFASPVLVDYLRKLKIPDLTIVSPDAGGVERARAFAKRLNADLAVGDKRRVTANEAEVMHVIGQVGGRNVVICDDMIDTAGTLVNTALALRKKKAKRIFACATHAVLSGPAIERLRKVPLDEIILTNTVPTDESRALPNFTFLSVGDLLAKAIRSIHEETSVSNLFV